MDRIKAQSDEFKALVALWEAFDDLPAIVDDDYPAARHKYEGKLVLFIKAFATNAEVMIVDKHEKPAAYLLEPTPRAHDKLKAALTFSQPAVRADWHITPLYRKWSVSRFRVE